MFFAPASPFSALAAPLPRRLRPAGPRCRGGASSVLRLAQPAVPRLPRALDLADWIDRTTGDLLPVTGPLAEFRAAAGA